MPFPVKLEPQKRLYIANTFLAPPPRGVAALVSVSDGKIQITILILRRGALSTQSGPPVGNDHPDEGPASCKRSSGNEHLSSLSP